MMATTRPTRMGTGQWSTDMSDQRDRFRSGGVEPGQGPEEEIRQGGAIPDGTDTEGHAIREDWLVTADPDNAGDRGYRPAVPDGDDAEGQGMRYMVIPFSADNEPHTRRRPADEPGDLRERPGVDPSESRAARHADKVGPDETIRWRP